MSVIIALVIDLIIIAVTCFVHRRIETTMHRAKAITLSLLFIGLMPFAYLGLWVYSGQQPGIDLTFCVTLGVTTLATMLVYSVTVVLCKKDIAPSR